MRLATPLTELLGIEHPIILAPMGYVAGGALAAAVTRGGGLGMLGFGFGYPDWMAREQSNAQNARVGCGFITWSLAQNPKLLDQALKSKPVAVMLSFGDPAPFASRIRESGAKLICQIQKRSHAEHALECGADILVAQGSEAGGHGRDRGALTLVPEVVDLVQAQKRTVPVVLAGGVGDGRALAAALSLGADGVLVGSRFWATKEALVPPEARRRALEATGDDTLQTSVTDIARKKNWPPEYPMRCLENEFIKRWSGREPALREQLEAQHALYERARDEGDFDTAAVVVGEAIGLIRDIPSAQDLPKRIVDEAVRAAQSLISRVIAP